MVAILEKDDEKPMIPPEWKKQCELFEEFLKQNSAFIIGANSVTEIPIIALADLTFRKESINNPVPYADRQRKLYKDGLREDYIPIIDEEEL